MICLSVNPHRSFSPLVPWPNSMGERACWVGANPPPSLAPWPYSLGDKEAGVGANPPPCAPAQLIGR